MLAPVVLLMFSAMSRTITLAPGETHLRRPLELKGDAKNLTIRGAAAGSTLVMDRDFAGAAAIAIDGGDKVTLSGFSIRGNRGDLKSHWYLPLKEAAFADYYSDNAILIRRSRSIAIQNVHISAVRAFPILVNASTSVKIDSVQIADSGTLNEAGRNNTTGGILLEEGVSDFEISRTVMERIAGNAIWTHSYARSRRSSAGFIHDNTIRTVGRDAIQVGHATDVRVQRNSGSDIGYPLEYVDAEHHGTPVALDTAGNVDKTAYTANHFTDVNGECVNLDGFHDGMVSGNSCLNEKSLDAYPALHYAVIFGNNDPAATSSGIVFRENTMRGFAYGAVFLVGSGNRVEANRFSRINLAHCGVTPVSARCNYAPEQPGLLASGVYLSGNGGRAVVTHGNIIEHNEIEGFQMEKSCVVAAPGVDLKANQAADNRCVSPRSKPGSRY